MLKYERWLYAAKTATFMHSTRGSYVNNLSNKLYASENEKKNNTFAILCNTYITHHKDIYYRKIMSINYTALHSSNFQITFYNVNMYNKPLENHNDTKL